MINNITVPKYRELLPLLSLRHHLFEGYIVDDASLEVMLRIEKEMHRLKVMGDDQRRTLWIEIYLPGQSFDWDEDRKDRNGNIWYWVSSTTYKNFHSLTLCDRCSKIVDLRNQPCTTRGREEAESFTDVLKPLLRLEKYIRDIVDAICASPAAYNDYVANNLPYWKKTGSIPRSVLNRICSLYRSTDNPESEIEMIETVCRSPVTTFDEMTLDTYMHYWRLAYLANSTRKDSGPNGRDPFKDISDKEFFGRSSTGNNLEDYKLDSQEDFLRWKDASYPYHCFDIVYARVSLFPRRDNTGKWHFEIYYNISYFFNDVLRITRGLFNLGIVLDISHWAEDALEQLREEDVVGVSPRPNKYREEIEIPWVGDGITRKMVNAIIRATTWDKAEEVLPAEEADVEAGCWAEK